MIFYITWYNILVGVERRVAILYGNKNENSSRRGRTIIETTKAKKKEEEEEEERREGRRKKKRLNAGGYVIKIHNLIIF